MKLIQKPLMSVLLVSLLAVVGCSKQEAAKEAATPTNVAYVTSQKAGVTKIDLNTMEVLQTFDVKAKSPRGVAITEDGKFLVIATKGNESITLIDTATGEVANVIHIGKNPEFVRVNGDYAYISSEPSAKGGPPPRPGEHEEEEDDDDDDDEDALPAKIAIVDLVEGKKIREITGGPETEGIEFSADGKNIVITNEADNTITVHAIETGELVKTIETASYGKRPRGIKKSPDGSQYIATLEFGNQYLVIDADFNVVKAVNTAETPYGVAFDVDGKNIIVAANRAHQLQMFDANTHELVKSVETGKRCWHFTYTPDDSNILLACGKSDDVYVISSDTFEVSKKIPVSGMPWGIVTYPKSMGSLDTK